MKVTATWGREETNRIVLTDQDVDSRIGKIIQENKSKFPILLVIHAHGHDLSFPVGKNTAFL